MQKIVNVIALASGIVSTAVIASGVYVYVNRDAIIDGVKSQAIEAVTGSLGGGLGGALGGGDAGFAPGATDLVPMNPPADQATAPDAPSSSVPGGGLGIPTF